MTRKGIPNRKYDQADVILSRCKKCGSTERTGYRSMHETKISQDIKGNPATHVVWRACCCKNCGQHRRDMFYENRILESGIGKTTFKQSSNDSEIGLE